MDNVTGTSSDDNIGQNMDKAIGTHAIILIKLLIENKLIICALGNLHYKISREIFDFQPGALPLELSWFTCLLRRSEVRIPDLVQILLFRSYNVDFPRHKL